MAPTCSKDMPGFSSESRRKNRARKPGELVFPRMAANNSPWPDAGSSERSAITLPAKLTTSASAQFQN
eukprot:9635432-Alexandrium_andersonii.AAC.1